MMGCDFPIITMILKPIHIMTTTIQRLLLAATLCLFLFPGKAEANERKLDSAKATRSEIRHSMMGMRNTMIFYTFANEKAALQLVIDNKDASFPISGKILLFADDTTKEAIEKWINNRHSDAIHPDAPTPILSQSLPEGQCSVTAHKALEKVENRRDKKMFQDHEVTLSMKAYVIEGKLSLAAFTDTSKVYLKL